MSKYVKDRRHFTKDRDLYEILHSGENYYLCKLKGAPDTWGYHHIIKHVDAELVDDVIRVGDTIISKLSGDKSKVIHIHTSEDNLVHFVCEKDGRVVKDRSVVFIIKPHNVEKCYG